MLLVRTFMRDCYRRSIRPSRCRRLARDPKRSSFDNIVANRVADQFRGRPQLELVHCGGAVRFDGLDADLQRFSDFLVDLALGD